MTITLFSAILADRLGFGEAFSEGRDAGQWLRHLYEESRPRAQEEGIALPSFDDFWQQGVLEYSAPERPQIFSPIFRADPQRYPLSTPPAKLELFFRHRRRVWLSRMSWPSVVG
ncbi:hypothetical protein LNP24_17805 [Klebsiella pneumoniae subsp. pneumoniae]|nr:hypothetical protein [Klebsiella pneumoniae subsp. pneumoniae]